jgi:hypothetical protein
MLLAQVGHKTPKTPKKTMGRRRQLAQMGHPVISAAIVPLKAQLRTQNGK